MCDCKPKLIVDYAYCLGKPLSLLILDCWQREYDKRPYRHFRFSQKDFEERMERFYHNVKDFEVIVEFLRKRFICSAKLTGFRIEGSEVVLLQDFIRSLKFISCISLRLMDLPLEFFQLMLENVHNLAVRKLNLEGSPLSRDVVPILQEFVYKSKTLIALNVNFCGIQQYDFALLVDGVYKSPKVSIFHCGRLLGSKLGLETAKMMNLLAQLIWINRLVELDIQKCEFNGHDMETLAEYMRSRSCRLRNLNVAYNIIGPDGAKHLLRSISFSSSLTHLNMAGNELGSHGGEHVAHYLSACGCLEYLNIAHNDIGAESINMILTAMKKPLMLSRLELYNNHFDSYSAMVLRRLIEARVLPQSTIDITYTPDETGENYRIIPYKEFKKMEI